MRLTQRQRLKQNFEFQAVFAEPRVSSDHFFRVLSRPNGLAFCRLGLAVSRKACRAATGRNRIKRFIRESFRLNQGTLAQAGGQDIVVLAKPPAAAAASEPMRASLEAHWTKTAAPGAPQPPKNQDN